MSWRVRYSSRATAKPGDSPKRSSRRALPLSKTRIDVLRLLASQRDPESYVAAATPLRRDALRYSGDTDVFHDREERFASAALSDAPALEAAGYGVRWLRQAPLVYAAEVTRQDAGTRLEWVVDSDFRFSRHCAMRFFAMSCTRLTLP